MEFREKYAEELARWAPLNDWASSALGREGVELIDVVVRNHAWEDYGEAGVIDREEVEMVVTYLVDGTSDLVLCGHPEPYSWSWCTGEGTAAEVNKIIAVLLGKLSGGDSKS